MATPTDVELLEAWRDGDQQSGEALFDRHFTALYRFFRSKASQGIDDLVQKTLLACVEGRDRFRGEASFRTYLFTTARRILYRTYENQRKTAQRIDFEASSVADLEGSPSSVLIAKHEHRLLLEALRMIPLDYQVALELYHFEGLTGPQLAQVLEIPESAVRSRLRRGVERVRKTLEALELGGSELESTLSGLEDWADEIRELLGPPLEAD